MEIIDYSELYKIQDEILDVFFESETEFYLTGGTCLNRFYWEKRYSVDLDFFTNFSNTFHQSFRNIIDICDKLFLNNFEEDFDVLTEDVCHERINSFVKK
jgi:predicted nucleotidyltransferase component of viral defense system